MEPPPERGWLDVWQDLDSQVARSARGGSYLVDAVARRRARPRERETNSRRAAHVDRLRALDGDATAGRGRAARGPPIALWPVLALGILFVLVPELLCLSYWVLAVAIAIRAVWRFRHELAARSREFD